MCVPQVMHWRSEAHRQDPRPADSLRRLQQGHRQEGGVRQTSEREQGQRRITWL